MEALLVDEPADEQDQLLVGRREARAQARQVGDGLQVARVDAVRDRGDPLARDAEDVRDLLAHEVRARDHVVGAAGHPPLDAVDVRLRVLVDPALVAPVLGRVHRHEPRQAAPARERTGRGGDEPVVRVDEVEAAAELEARGEHVLVHVVDPGDERVEIVLRELRLAHAVHDDAVTVLVGVEPPAAARDDVDLVAVAHELLGQLAHVPREAALDDRRVLPRQGQDPHGVGPYRHAAAPRASRRRSGRHGGLPSGAAGLAAVPADPPLKRRGQRVLRARGGGGRRDGRRARRRGRGVPRARRAPRPSLRSPGPLPPGARKRAPAPRPGRSAAARAVGVPAQHRDAIAFYEAHGFAIVKATEGANNEEKEPDYLMAWHTIA